MLRTAGLMLISNAVVFTPLIASADGDSTVGAVVGFPLGAFITGSVLVSMSRTKHKATKADHYVKGKLDLHDSRDNYLRTSTSKTKIKD
ncbi:hypothetical protein [Ruminococcus sp. YE71]|uniref:hypothetical protein n=1 Tax=Ruminococcus sp. YE71 TaxID=244362 RepID=UPI0011145901|nr:hypothetical protein [Ruminococcus sp. YE71]